MIPKRIVIDTNVCLDLFVFCDPRWAGLHAALDSGALEAVTRADCRREWQIVLGYAHLPLDADSRPTAAARFDSLIRCIEAPAAADAPRLPVCKDTDDQKFLELARDSDAVALITKDKALLKLARRAAKAGLFLIIPPERWQAILEEAGASPADPLPQSG